MHFHLQLCTVAAVVTFWGSSRSGFLPSPNYLNSWSGSFLLSSSIQPMFIPLLHHLSQLLSSELSVVKLQYRFLCIHKLRTAGQPFSPHREPALSAVPPLLFSALPLTASRVLLNLFQSLEAISIPLALQKYGMSISASLSTYGILTGIALPCILFPSALTNSISTMLLPEVASMPDAQKKMLFRSFYGKLFFLPVSWFCLPAIFLYRIRLYQQTDLSYTRSRKLYLNTSIYLSFSL